MSNGTLCAWWSCASLLCVCIPQHSSISVYVCLGVFNHEYEESLILSLHVFTLAHIKLLAVNVQCLYSHKYIILCVFLCSFSRQQASCPPCPRVRMSSSLWWRSWRMTAGSARSSSRTATALSCPSIRYRPLLLVDTSSPWRPTARRARPCQRTTLPMTSSCCSTPGMNVSERQTDIRSERHHEVDATDS